ncbi:uncharacterized protein LOC101853351 [Aplysia californica]|uniref:Uncharacterized protein LOC101853351 n=1 Tax=Aplysia californica TaxID=6500 RepID=A0ABM0K5E4_APLCA|nr:uncharacterized protein LOC101853351 [Aplysia californica]
MAQPLFRRCFRLMYTVRKFDLPCSKKIVVQNQGCSYSSKRPDKTDDLPLLFPQRVKNVRTRRTEPLASLRSLTPRHDSRKKERQQRRIESSRFLEEMRLVDEDVFTDSLAVENSVNTLGNPVELKENYMRALISTSKKIRFKTIEKKFFKKRKSLNLLTWRAKEQIRFLNRGDPETWTVQALADSFPVSEESIVKILKSRVRLHRTEDIQRHDSDIQRNWSGILESFEDEDEAVSKMLYLGFFSSDNESLILNANGRLDLPFPMKKNDGVKGPFSDIVKDCWAESSVSDKSKQTGFITGGEMKTLSEVLTEVSEFFANGSFTPPRHWAAKPDVGNSAEDFMQQPGGHKPDSNVKIPNKLCVKGLSSQDSSKRKHLKQGIVYQDGNSIYNEDGEFLYRIP